jgi:hypothetical protein
METVLNRSFKLEQDVVARTNQDGTVIIMKMDESNTFYKINGIAAEYWRSVSNNMNFEDFITNITTEYSVDRDVVLNDITKLTEKLLEKKLIL